MKNMFGIVKDLSDLNNGLDEKSSNRLALIVKRVGSMILDAEREPDLFEYIVNSDDALADKIAAMAMHPKGRKAISRISKGGLSGLLGNGEDPDEDTSELEEVVFRCRHCNKVSVLSSDGSSSINDHNLLDND